MASERLEVRLDEERRRKLAEIAGSRDLPVSEAVRRLIDDAYESLRQERRLEAARILTTLEIEDVPDPEELSRPLSGASEPTGLP